ncbi:MAG: DUF1232 domain-containing protein [Anaerolineae bacterium]|nr:DUF1232 domain-containing protein [Anaerolineae bacterium]
MSKSPSSDLYETAGFLGGLFKQIRLAWRLYKDGRVPGWVKLIPVAGLFYLLSPIDLLPDLMLPGLGEVDDVVMLLLALKMFVDFSPSGIVREHLHDLYGAKEAPSNQAPYIDAPYRVIDDEEQRKE